MGIATDAAVAESFADLLARVKSSAGALHLEGSAGTYIALLGRMVAATAVVQEKFHEGDLKAAREVEIRLTCQAGALMLVLTLFC